MELPDSKLAVELLRLTRRCRGIDKYVSSSAGMTIDEMHCLSALFADHPSSVTRLCELINVPPTRASKLLRGLEQRGFVTRTPHAADRRREEIVLTDSGMQAAQAILSLFAEVGTELLGPWRKEIAADFSWLLRSVLHTEQVDDSG